MTSFWNLVLADSKAATVVRRRLQPSRGAHYRAGWNNLLKISEKSPSADRARGDTCVPASNVLTGILMREMKDQSGSTCRRCRLILGDGLREYLGGSRAWFSHQALVPFETVMGDR